MSETKTRILRAMAERHYSDALHVMEYADGYRAKIGRDPSCSLEIRASLDQETAAWLYERANGETPAARIRKLKWELVDDDHWAAEGLGMSFEVRKSQLMGRIRARLTGEPRGPWETFDGDADSAMDFAENVFQSRIREWLY